MADYSGKQKITVKLTRAKLIIYVGNKTEKFLSREKFTNPIVVLDDSESTIKVIIETFEK